MTKATCLKPQTRSRNVLVIEDDEDTRQVLQTVLAEEGFAVRAAVDRDDAVGHLKGALFQVILMDFSMPGKSAAEFVEIVRAISPASKIVLITARENAANAAASLGLSHALGKPLILDDLLALLERID